MTAPPILPLVDAGLGNSAYLVDLGDGRGLAVDPARDLRGLRHAARRLGVTVRHVAETHLHADFLSGGLQLAADDAAAVIASAGSGREFPYRGLADGERLDLGGLSMEALATPGHTLEHVAYLLRDGDEPVALFTGGSLIVGAAARTDLVDPDAAAEHARLQWRSLQRLLRLPDDLAVYPTHGVGSFCSAPPGADRTTTIGRERAGNPLLARRDEEDFVDGLLASLGSYPTYFRWLAEVNRRGPALLDGPPGLTPLGAAQVADAVARGAVVVDVRPVQAYATGHVPGSLSIVLRDAFASWLGWVVDRDRPVVIVRDADQDPAEIAWQAAKIGYDGLGELAGGMPAWTGAGQPVRATAVADAREVDPAHVLDVRQSDEWRGGHLPGATLVELGSLPGADLDGGPHVLMCGHGERAATAASVLERAGHDHVAVLRGGPDDWARATGRPLAVPA